MENMSCFLRPLRIHSVLRGLLRHEKVATAGKFGTRPAAQ